MTGSRGCSVGLLGLGASERLFGGLRLGLQRLEHLQRELRVARLALVLRELRVLLRDRFEQELDLRLLRVRDPAQLLDVLLAIEIDHDLYRSHRGIRNNRFSLDRDRRQRTAIDQRAAFDE